MSRWLHIRSCALLSSMYNVHCTISTFANFLFITFIFLLVPDTAYTIAHGKCFSRSLPFLYDFSATEAALRINRGSCGMTERLSLTLARRVWKNPEAGWASPKKEWSGKWLDWNGVAGINQSPTSPIDPSLRHVYKMCRPKEKQSFFFYLLKFRLKDVLVV